MRPSSTLPLPSSMPPLAVERPSQRVTVRGGPLDSVVTSMRNTLQRLPRGSAVLHASFVGLDEAFQAWAWHVASIFATGSCVGTKWWDAERHGVRVVSRFVWPQTTEHVVVRVVETDEPDVLRRRMAVLLTEEPSEPVPAAFPLREWPSPALVLDAVRRAEPIRLDWLAALHTANILASRAVKS